MAKPEKVTEKTQGMAMVSGEVHEMSEIVQTKGQLIHNRMVDRVTHSQHHMNRRKVQWKSGRLKKRRDCAKLPASQRSFHKTPLSLRLRATRTMKNKQVGKEGQAGESARIMNVPRHRVAVTGLGLQVRGAIIINKDPALLM
jgi:hypothetical protein